MSVAGETLIALRSATLPPRPVRREARILTARLLAAQLDGRELKSQGVMRQMMAASQPTIAA